MTIPASTFMVDEIANDTATTDPNSRFNVCQRTGFKVKVDALSTEWHGVKVRPESYEPRNQQDFVSADAESLTGAIRPEPTDVFITSSVAPEDY